MEKGEQSERLREVTWVKGFRPSESGRHPNALVGKGSAYGNRKQRRQELSSKGLHRRKSGILLVTSTGKFRSRIQTIFVKNKLGMYTGEVKKIQHWDPK